MLYINRRVGLVLAVVLATILVAGSALPASEDSVFELSGSVVDPSGEPVAGVTISLGDREWTSDELGALQLTLSAGSHRLTASRAGYLTASHQVMVQGDLEEVILIVESRPRVSETITVDAVRAGASTPVTKKTIDAGLIDEISHGQDVPAMLEATPSISWYSDSGSGSNYSYFSLRGISQSRINITLDGAPLNDPAEHALYFNNFKGIADAVDSIQVQRGVGTSTVGSPSYGGSVNFASARLTQDRETTVEVGVGSHAQRRASLTHQSGRLSNGLALFTHVTVAESDNYRDSSGTEHATVFFNGDWQGERSQVKLVTFSGREKSQMAFYAVEPEILADSPRFNPLDEAERDDFGQRFAQLQYVRALGDVNTLVASVYYNGADGWFRLWGDPVAKSDLLQFGIDQHFVGSMVSLSRDSGSVSTTLGLHYNDFRGDHTLEIDGAPIYRNTGYKSQANAFAKVGYTLGKWHLFGDLQLRWAEFDYRGDIELDSVDWSFVDPKVGARYTLSPRSSVYASIGKAEREPSRLDMLLGEDNATIRHDLQAVRPEKVVDLEAGFEHRGEELDLQVALYDMRFEDEIAATGELSEIGLPLRVNVDESYRRGVEVDLRWKIGDHWQVTNSTTLSRNRIEKWTQFYDVYDAQGVWVDSQPRLHRDVEHLLTPDVIINQGIEWSDDTLDAGLLARWVSRSNLDNTGNAAFQTPDYFTLGLRGGVRLARWPMLPDTVGRGRLRLTVDNLLDEVDHYASGYSYLFVNRDGEGTETIDGIPYYYPLAGRTVIVTLTLPL